MFETKSFTHCTVEAHIKFILSVSYLIFAGNKYNYHIQILNTQCMFLPALINNSRIY